MLVMPFLAVMIPLTETTVKEVMERIASPSLPF